MTKLEGTKRHDKKKERKKERLERKKNDTGKNMLLEN